MSKESQLHTVTTLYDARRVVVQMGNGRVLVTLAPGSTVPEVGQSLLVIPTPDGNYLGMLPELLEVQDEGTPLRHRGKLNFIGALVTAVDNVVTHTTDVTIAASPTIRTISWVLNGGGAAIATGNYLGPIMSTACTLLTVDMECDVSATNTFHIEKRSPAGSWSQMDDAAFGITAGIEGYESDLSGWTAVSLSARDRLRLVVVTNNTAQQISISVKAQDA